jgi:hypothetical protein
VSTRRNQNFFAKGRLKTGEMNKSEKAYSEYLEVLRGSGEIKWWRFEGMKLRLGDNTFLTPDFNVMQADDELEMHDVKSFMMEDANVKLKVAADLYPFRFYVVRKTASPMVWLTSQVGNKEIKA